MAINPWLADFKQAKRELELCWVVLYDLANNILIPDSGKKPLALTVDWEYDDFGKEMIVVGSGIMAPARSQKYNGAMIWREDFASPLTLAKSTSLHLDYSRITIQGKWPLTKFFTS